MAEPAIGGNNLIGFDNNGSNNTSVNYAAPGTSTTPPTQIPTYNIDVNATSIPIDTSALSDVFQNSEVNLRGVENAVGEIIPVKIANFTKNGIIRVTGRYSQNYFDFPKYDLRVLNVITDEDVDFKFILCLKDGNDSIPKLYATKNLYETLVASYQYGNPIGVNDIINERNIVVVDLTPLKNKVEDLRVAELATDINLTNVSERDYVEVFRNLFVISNYETNESNALKANPTYNLSELFKYISWVVSKPSNNYDERLLDAALLGEWQTLEEVEIPAEDAPSTPINEEVDDNNNPTPPPPPLYPPIGRAGNYDEEEVFRDSILWIWNEDDRKWEFGSAGGSGNQSGGYGGFD